MFSVWILNLVPCGPAPSWIEDKDSAGDLRKGAPGPMQARPGRGAEPLTRPLEPGEPLVSLCLPRCRCAFPRVAITLEAGAPIC